jgi:N-acetylglucosaminyl-diphospho-decaprenol L-rhamnosyltransferase
MFSTCGTESTVRSSTISEARRRPALDTDVTAVVVTYNSARHIGACLDALGRALKPFRSSTIIVVDNASTDDTLSIVAESGTDAMVVPLLTNRGYAAGINTGIAAGRATGPVVVLNPDCAVAPDCIERLCDALLLDGVGIAVPRFVSDDGTTQHSLRREPTVLRAWGDALIGGTRAGRFPATGETVLDPARYDHDTDVDWATGAAWAISPRCRNSLGGWDESFFLYSEETDYALRARDAGFRVRYVAGAYCLHHGGESNASPPLWALLTVNRVRLFARRGGRMRTACFYVGVLVGEALRSIRGPAPTHRRALRRLLGRPD